MNVKEKIQQRRLQILVHSYIYYELNESIIEDSKWNEWANELVRLQNENPEIAETVRYSEIFKDFDGSTGFNLTYDDWVKSKAKQLLSLRKPQPKVKTTKAGAFSLF